MPSVSESGCLAYASTAQITSGMGDTNSSEFLTTLRRSLIDEHPCESRWGVIPRKPPTRPTPPERSVTLPPGNESGTMTS